MGKKGRRKRGRLQGVVYIASLKYAKAVRETKSMRRTDILALFPPSTQGACDT